MSIKGKHLKIDLGAGDPRDGESSPEGYLKQDVDASIPGIDLVCNIDKLDTVLKPGSCSIIRASHVIEHFPTAQIPRLMKMIHNLLEPGGTFEIIVPNFLYHINLCLMGNEEQAVYYLFGGQLDEWDFHKTAFTPKILRARLEEAGFQVIHLADESSITAIAQK